MAFVASSVAADTFTANVHVRQHPSTTNPYYASGSNSDCAASAYYFTPEGNCPCFAAAVACAVVVAVVAAAVFG